MFNVINKSHYFIKLKIAVPCTGKNFYSNLNLLDYYNVDLAENGRGQEINVTVLFCYEAIEAERFFSIVEPNNFCETMDIRDDGVYLSAKEIYFCTWDNVRNQIATTFNYEWLVLYTSGKHTLALEKFKAAYEKSCEGNEVKSDIKILSSQLQEQAFVFLKRFFPKELTKTLLQLIECLPSRRVICGNQAISWIQRDIKPEDFLYKVMFSIGLIDFCLKVSGYTKEQFRYAGMWVNEYHTGEFINIHTDRSGNIQMIVCFHNEHIKNGGILHIIVKEGYDLCLMSDLPIDENKEPIPENKTIYLDRSEPTGWVDYVVLDPVGNIAKGSLYLLSMNNSYKLDKKYLQNNKFDFLANILELTSKRGHTLVKNVEHAMPMEAGDMLIFPANAIPHYTTPLIVSNDCLNPMRITLAIRLYCTTLEATEIAKEIAKEILERTIEIVDKKSSPMLFMFPIAHLQNIPTSPITVSNPIENQLLRNTGPM